MIAWPYQQVISSFDIFNINEDHFIADENNAQREQVDWLSPGWFALGVGDNIGTVLDTLANTTWLTIQHRDSLDNFQHACWKNDNPNDADVCQGYAHDNTYVMVLPPWEELEGMSLDSCKGDPPYEIMRVIDMFQDQQYSALRVERALFDTPKLSYTSGQQIRPIVWANPANWGAVAFFMNPTDTAPEAYVEGYGPYRYHDLGALFVANHHLKSSIILEWGEPSQADTFYLADGMRLDAYHREGPKNLRNRKMYLHSEGIDLDLDGIPDCKGGDPDSCESYIVEEWKEGYKAFLDSLRIYTGRIRGADSAFIIITNGHPSDPEQRQYLNGRFFEDANGKFQETDLVQVIARSRGYEDDTTMVDPKEILYFERDRSFPDSTATNLAQMRLTLAVSLLATDIGWYGTIGENDHTRSPIFEDVAIEDFYDEYAVDSLGRGYQHAEFPHADEEYLLGAKYYLGNALDTAKVYVHEGVVHEDMVYREFDHGVVIAHLAIGTGSGHTIPQIWIQDLELREPPDSTCHLMRIEGSDDPMYSDGKNNGEHPVVMITYVDPWDDDDLYGPGDAIILLKEGDGFFVHQGCACP